jgi:hypothetical protein
MKMKMKMKMKAVALTIVMLGSVPLAHSQIAINADILNANGDAAVIFTSSGALAPLTASVTFFWYDSSVVSTIQGWTKAADWTSSALFSQNFGSLSMGAGWSSIAPGQSQGLFSGTIEPGAISTSAVGKNLAIVVTSGTEIGVFKGGELVPANTPAPGAATPVNFYLSDVNSAGVLVGTFLPSVNVTILGDAPQTGIEAYQLLSGNIAAIPEPSVASLLALGTVALVALRVRRKS